MTYAGGLKMMKSDKKSSCCTSGIMDTSCKVESLITVDERGQMVLPKEMRDRANIKAGDKLALISWEKDGKVCCLTLIKAGDFGDMVKEMLGPMMKEMAGPSPSH